MARMGGGGGGGEGDLERTVSITEGFGSRHFLCNIGFRNILW
jgi:hypothetical protein